MSHMFCLMSSGSERSSEVPQSNSFILLDDFQTQLDAEQKLLLAFPTQGPQAEGVSLSLELHTFSLIVVRALAVFCYALLFTALSPTPSLLGL